MEVSEKPAAAKTSVVAAACNCVLPLDICAGVFTEATALPVVATSSQPIVVAPGIYLAGDSTIEPSQNGALKSGRLAINACLTTMKKGVIHR